ncbi:MAG: cytidylate kinase family protein [Candidatus Woesearchaeota archaeon]
MKQQELLRYLAKIIVNIKQFHPIRVGIDGVDASGKTTLANELAEELKSYNRQIIRVSIDGFHNSKEIRYKKGRDSPEGYYFDSFNNQAIIENVLKPLSLNGDLHYTKAVFDFKTEAKVIVPTEQANMNAILLMDGVFLFRPELVNYWDIKIFLDVDFKITLQRALKRDGYYLGSEQQIIEKYNQRYVPGQRLYFRDANPKEMADFVIDNNDFNNPLIKKESMISSDKEMP